VLNGVERRRLLVEPAGEDPAELAVGAAHVELDESAGQLLDLPGRGRLAGAQPHDGVADPHRLAGPECQVALEAVALVEQADHGDPLRHRRRARRELVHRLGDIDRLVLELGLLLPIHVLGTAGRTGGEREQRRQARAGNEPAHRDQSGVQA
jgi:hypothetical protein